VVLERFAGQVVLLVVGVTVLLTQPALISAVADDLAGSRGVLIAVLCVLAVLLALAAWAVWGRRTSTWHRALATALTDGRVGLLARDTWPGVALLSAAAVAGHLALFVVAARVAGSPATIAQLLPPLVLALLVMGLPVNIGGWGPREAISTLAFGAAGLGATQGLTVAVVYGVLTLVSSLPGAVVRFRRRGDWQARPAQRVEPPDDPLGGEAAARGIREPAGQLGGSGRATARVLPTAVPRSRQGRTPAGDGHARRRSRRRARGASLSGPAARLDPTR
jgi:hypothetical protein